MASEKHTRFEEIIGDKAILALMLDGLLTPMGMSFDILTKKENETLFGPQDMGSLFCHILRQTDNGNELCRDCDLEYAAKAFEARKSIHYICHAGMGDIATPIYFADKEQVATIFTGQYVPENETAAEEQERLQMAKIAAKKADVSVDELLDARKKNSRRLSEAQVEEIKSSLENIAVFIEEVGVRYIRMEWMAERAQALNEAGGLLSGTSKSISEAWETIAKALLAFTSSIDTYVCSLIYVVENNELVIKAVADLPDSYINASYSLENCENDQTASQHNIGIFDPERFVLHRHIAGEERGAEIITYVSTHFELAHTSFAAMVVFLTDTLEEIENSPTAEPTLNMFSEFVGRVATHYHNAASVEQYEHDQQVRTDWVAAVSHQWVVPIHSIIGYVEMLQDNETIKSVPNDVKDYLQAIMMMARHASRIAKNFQLYAKGLDKLELELEYELTALLIARAREVQGLTPGTNISGPNVTERHVENLEGKLKIHKDLFAQAYVNLLDNAAKYADEGTTILVDAELDKNFAYIHVINEGIPIYREEMEKIFDPYERTEAAKQRFPIGTGIGLYIARGIIRAHNGDLTVVSTPSDKNRYKTTFTIKLSRADKRSEE
jgi:signal transduction histidine kinase/ligand-binding sensor protein